MMMRRGEAERIRLRVHVNSGGRISGADYRVLAPFQDCEPTDDTTKVVICRNGQIAELLAMDVGARLVALDASNRITRLEPAAHVIAAQLGLSLAVGAHLPLDQQRAVAAYMVSHLLAEVCVRRRNCAPSPMRKSSTAIRQWIGHARARARPALTT